MWKESNIGAIRKWFKESSNPEEILELIAINPLKKDKDYSITLLFNKNRIITLTTEVIEATLEDQNN